jgi:hypothetical protein
MPKDHQPLLVRLATRQSAVTGPEPASRYDSHADQLQVEINGRWVYAVDAGPGGPRTKKADVESGEDVKGWW